MPFLVSLLLLLMLPIPIFKYHIRCEVFFCQISCKHNTNRLSHLFVYRIWFYTTKRSVVEKKVPLILYFTVTVSFNLAYSSLNVWNVNSERTIEYKMNLCIFISFVWRKTALARVNKPNGYIFVSICTSNIHLYDAQTSSANCAAFQLKTTPLCIKSNEWNCQHSIK